jgi:antirestriction protein ArdC
LARNLAGRFGSAAYAVQELAAELRPDHACYVARWLDLLRADRRAVFTAAGKAQAAADWLLAAAAGGAAVPQHGAPPAKAPMSIKVASSPGSVVVK